jgi:hypothetical protein
MFPEIITKFRLNLCVSNTDLAINIGMLYPWVFFVYFGLNISVFLVDHLSEDVVFLFIYFVGQHDGPLPRQHAGLLPESLIWAYIVQLSSALRTIHTAGLACRVMDPTKILITGKTR